MIQPAKSIKPLSRLIFLFNNKAPRKRAKTSIVNKLKVDEKFISKKYNGSTKAVIPRTAKMLKIFDPIKLPIDMLF